MRSWLTGSRFVSLPFSDHCEPLIECAEQIGTLVSTGGAESKGRAEICGITFRRTPASNLTRSSAVPIPIPYPPSAESSPESRCLVQRILRIAFSVRSVARNGSPSPMKRALARRCSSNCMGCFSQHGRVTTCPRNYHSGLSTPTRIGVETATQRTSCCHIWRWSRSGGATG